MKTHLVVNIEIDLPHWKVVSKVHGQSIRPTFSGRVLWPRDFAIPLKHVCSAVRIFDGFSYKSEGRSPLHCLLSFLSLLMTNSLIYFFFNQFITKIIFKGGKITQISEQILFDCFFFTIGFYFLCITNLIASSKTSFNPYCVKALHSMYLHLNSSYMIVFAAFCMIGAYFGFFFIRVYCSRRSILFPTKILGALPMLSCS